ncbi:hypothetical protein QWJ46_05355 [Rhizobium sp. CBN3]|uniref:hypothetical protein n=1 Tax=Rhizobium sp. CBN3 TaxID=3058045 RepID=UPI002670E7DD|nr:hypothetical protein [Rhizobium sp. CBN3]MDO3432106.1 hypothetical protein [Rhizobium sp. CBN3]
MLETLLRYARHIHAIDPAEAERAYREAMAFLEQSQMALDEMLDEPAAAAIRQRLQLIAEAAQQLAYEYYHQHGRAIDDSALDPGKFTYDYLPPGHKTRRLEPIELAREILRYLQDVLPHTLPPEMRQ